MAKNEIEIKLSLFNAEEVTEFLDENGDFSYENHQIDTYFDSEATGWLKENPSAYWLRIREEDGKCSINYKDYSEMQRAAAAGSVAAMSCTELESDVSSPRDIEGILGAIAGFRPAIKVDKVRRAYKFNDCEVALDSVKDLGDFVEVEYYGDESDKEKVTDLLQSTVEEIGAETGEAQRFGYPYLLLIKNGIKKQSNKDKEEN